MRAPVLYLAGPEVFLADAVSLGEAKKQLCRGYGFEGLFPLDVELSVAGEAPSRRIFEGNVAQIRLCDGLLANLTPFRGPSADVGTVFELAFAFALDKPVFAYTNVAGDYAARVCRGDRCASSEVIAADGLKVEDFGLFDNLMIAEALFAQGREVVVREAPAERRFLDLAAFELCLRQAAAFFAGGEA